MNAVKELGDPKTALASTLGTLVSSFSQSPLTHGKKMRDLLALSPEAFRVATVSALHHSADPRGYRYLVTLLTTNDLLIPLISDTSLPLKFASELASTAVKIDPQLHFRLTRTLADNMFESRDLAEETACRLLEVLGSITDIAGLQTFLRQILSHPSPRVRSKAVSFVGRGPAGARALGKLLTDENERVRANAAEALWDFDPELALPMFSQLLDDPHHRVVGNAIVGLYRGGSLRSMNAIRGLMSHPDPMFRATGVWAMGRTWDPRYLTQLARMLAESSGSGRRGLFNAIDGIKKAAAKRAANPPLKVFALRATADENRKITVHVVVQGQSTSKPLPIYPTGFALSADDTPVSTIACLEQLNVSVALCFLLPCRLPGNERFDQCLEHALSTCLKAKPRREPWSITYYTLRPTAQQTTTRLFGVDLTPEPAVIAGASPSYTISTELLHQKLLCGTELHSLPGWIEAVSSSLEGLQPARASRNLITFVDSTAEINSESIMHLQQLALDARVAIHVLGRDADERISDLCAATGGCYRHIESGDDLESQFLAVVAAIKNSFAVTFLCPENSAALPQRIGIQVFNNDQFGQTEWRGPVTCAQSSKPFLDPRPSDGKLLASA